MACLLCVRWPALKGIFHLFFFFLDKESVQSAQLCIYWFPSLVSQLILNCASQPPCCFRRHINQSDSPCSFGSILKSVPVFPLIVTITFTTILMTNAAPLVFLISYVFLSSYISLSSCNGSWRVWQLPSHKVLLSWPTSTCSHWHISMAYYKNEGQRFTWSPVLKVQTHTHACAHMH